MAGDGYGIIITRLEGLLDGFKGTYDVDVGVSYGIKVKLGDEIKASVHAGKTTSGIIIVDDINLDIK